MAARTPVPALVAPALAGILVLLVLVDRLSRWADEGARRRLLWWTIGSFAAHLAIGVGSTEVSHEIRYYLGADSLTYDATARQMVEHWTTGASFPLVPNGKEGFFYMLAALYWAFGNYTVAGLVVNATMAAAIVPLMSDATYRLFGVKSARYVAPLVVVMPGFLLFTSQLMREAGMLLLLAVILNRMVRLTDHVTVGSLLWLVAAVLLAFTFRSWVALSVAASLLLGLALGRRDVLSGIGVALSVLSIVAIAMLGSGVGRAGYKTAADSDLSQAALVRREQATAASSYNPDVDVSSASQALFYLPIGVVTFALGPFPWTIRGISQFPYVPDMVMWWMLLPSLWTGHRAARGVLGRRRMILVCPAVTTLLLLSFAIANFGTVVRERQQVFIFLVPIVALGLAVRRDGEADSSMAVESTVRHRAAARAPRPTVHSEAQ